MPTGIPAGGDTADDAGGALVLTFTGTELHDNTLNLSGGATIAFDNGSTLDAGSTLNGIAGTADVNGLFNDIGNISLISGDTLVVSIAGGGTLLSDGLTGNDIGINDGGAGEFNGGTLYVLGGTLDNQEIHVNGGYADVTAALMSNDELSIDGGKLEIAQQNTVSPPNLVFVNADTSVASTLKFDNLGSFNGDGVGQISNFTIGDTIDIGANTIGTIVYNAGSGYGNLTVENTSGSTIFSTLLGSGDAGNFQSGTFAVGVSGGTAGSFLVTQGSGDTLISEAPTSTTSPSPASEAFYGGGTSDILFQNLNSGILLDWQMSGGAYAGSTAIAGATSDWEYVGTGDFYGDGTSDILFQNLNSGILLDWQMANGTYDGSTAIAGASMGWKFLGTGDFTGSGTDDILFQNTNGQVLYWNMQNGAYNGSVGVAGASSDWSYVGAGDFTGNGTDDILFQNTNGQLLYWQMSGGSYAGSMALPAASAGWKVLGTGDFYGNGVSDILFQNANSGLLLDWQISTTGTYEQAVALGAAGANEKFAAIGDYTGNGTDDILFQNTTNGQVSYWEMNDGAHTNTVGVAGATSDWKLLSG
jgi:ribosomal protein L27